MSPLLSVTRRWHVTLAEASATAIALDCVPAAEAASVAAGVAPFNVLLRSMTAPQDPTSLVVGSKLTLSKTRNVLPFAPL